MEECEPFDFGAPPCDPKELAARMIEVMKEHRGYGLSACQIGVPYRVFVMDSEPQFVCFNPKVVSHSEETIELEEGCLSFPGVMARIERPRHVRLRFTNEHGETRTQQFTGMSARVVLHEMDHLNGILFYNHLSQYKRDKLLKQFHKGMKNAKPSQTSPLTSFFAPLEHAADLLVRERGRSTARSG